nr:hypothetical protein HmN_000606300 [Hymenolepis microstoma]
MGRFNNQDRLIEFSRDRLKQKLQERRLAAMTAKGNTERTRDRAILSSQEMVENKQRNLGLRIEEEMKNLGEVVAVADNEVIA